MAGSAPADTSVSSCCLKGFEWDGTPAGTETRLEGTGAPAYVTGTNPSAAVLVIADLFGWTFPNIRLLADHYAREADVTVYVPDFFGGEVLPIAPLLAGRWHEVDLQGFMARNAREVREPEILQFAAALRGKHARVGAVGFCYGGWAVHRLGASEHATRFGGRGLVDCVTAGHPSLLTEKDIDEAAVPVQILAPEFDQVYTAELKSRSFTTALKNGLPFDYQHFPGVEHACLVRGDPNKKGERDAMVRGKNATVAWLKEWLHEPK